VLDRSAAVDFVPGVAVDETIPAGETRLYRFDARAGDRYYFDTEYVVSYSTWQLIDPWGRTVNSGYTYSDYPDIALAASGEYLLAISPYYPASGNAQVRFNLQPKSVSNASLTLNQPVTGAIAPGETIKYSFTLDAATRVQVDTSTADYELPYGLFWSLSGPRAARPAATLSANRVPSICRRATMNCRSARASCVARPSRLPWAMARHRPRIRNRTRIWSWGK
jgi:hypothetical protein